MHINRGWWITGVKALGEKITMLKLNEFTSLFQIYNIIV